MNSLYNLGGNFATGLPSPTLEGKYWGNFDGIFCPLFRFSKPGPGILCQKFSLIFVCPPQKDWWDQIDHHFNFGAFFVKKSIRHIGKHSYVHSFYYLPSRELTYPTWGKGKSSSKCNFSGGYVSSLDGIHTSFPAQKKAEKIILHFDHLKTSPRLQQRLPSEMHEVAASMGFCGVPVCHDASKRTWGPMVKYFVI